MNDASTPQPDYVLIVANPHSGAREATQLVAEVQAALRARGLQAEIITDLGELGSAVANLQARGCLRAVVAAGGDGTVAEILNRTEPGVPLAVFPLGTANLLAKYLGIAPRPAPFANMIAAGHCCQLDAAAGNGRVFFLMAGIGFDAEVVRRLHEERSGHINYLTYARPILETLRDYNYPPLRAICQPQASQSAAHGERDAIQTPCPPMEGRWTFVVNLPCYAGGLMFAAEAVGTDGLLNVCTFGEGSSWQALRYLGYIMLQKHQGLKDCQQGLTSRLRIESESLVPYQLDGDPGGVLPLEIEVLPNRLTLVVPKSLAIERGWQQFVTYPPRHAASYKAAVR